MLSMRPCFRTPIPALFDAARYLDAGASAHLGGNSVLAHELFRAANMPEVREWLESIWGAKSVYVSVQALPRPAIAERIELRMPTKAQIRELHHRDGFHCRYCGIPVIRPEVRKLACMLFPEVVSWGRTNSSQHAGFQALWAQYDHVLPHSCGGTNELKNLVVSCAACNYGKMSYRLEELGLSDPRDRPPVASNWDGLERLLGLTNCSTGRPPASLATAC
jgi:hypothetical protein